MAVQQEIIEGRTLKEEEVADMDNFLNEGESKPEVENVKMAGYWAKACKNQEVLGAEITDKDEVAL